jgi:hypothetical protein
MGRNLALYVESLTFSNVGMNVLLRSENGNTTTETRTIPVGSMNGLKLSESRWWTRSIVVCIVPDDCTESDISITAIETQRRNT